MLYAGSAGSRSRSRCDLCDIDVIIDGLAPITTGLASTKHSLGFPGDLINWDVSGGEESFLAPGRDGIPTYLWSGWNPKLLMVGMESQPTHSGRTLFRRLLSH